MEERKMRHRGHFRRELPEKSKYNPLNHEIKTQAQGEICAKLILYITGKFILRVAS